MTSKTFHRLASAVLIAVFLAPFASSASATAAYAQTGERIQIATGQIDEHTPGAWYKLSGLTAGQTLSIRGAGTSGNLDPLVLIADSSIQPGTLGQLFNAEVQAAIEAGKDPLTIIPEFASKYFVAWDDDSGGGLDAATRYVIPADGDYYALVMRSPLANTFGEYRLTMALDAAGELTDQSRATGEPFAELLQVRGALRSVEERSLTLTSATPVHLFSLNEFQPGDTLQVFVESTTPGRSANAQLLAFGSKPVRGGDLNADRTAAGFEYSFPEGGENYQLLITACCEDGTNWNADVRLLAGRNAPDVLTGEAESEGQPVVREPIPVRVGVKLDQITGVDQKAENYGAVYTMRMTWQDPALAFRPDDCNCDRKIYYGDDFAKFASQQDILWPTFVIDNQQNNRWVQNKAVVVFPDGRATYLERFTTALQAPDFNFRQFPFDVQQFYIRVDSLVPLDFFTFVPDDEFTEIGTALGEEEWYITDSQTSVTSGQFSTQAETARFEFRFWSRRHLVFYIFRILVPLGLIIVISWVTFFLQDYGKRVDAASGNLLLFFAYNFTIASDLPRLGYMTYLDSLLVGTFVITVLTLVYNVYLKRQEAKGRQTQAQRVDRYMIWLYPLGFMLAFGMITWRFFVNV